MKKIMFVCILFIGLMMVINASADTISFDLGVPNTAIAAYTGPYANVLVDRTSGTTADITFTAYSGFLLGAQGTVGVNVNGTYNIGAGSFGTLTSPTIGSGNEDGFGSFNLSVDNFDGYGYSVGLVRFTLIDTSGTWASASDVLAANAGGYIAAAHIFVDGGTAALATGFAANGSPPVSVPEPGTMMLLGSGLIGLVGIGRRKFNK